jgi:CDP-glycerol glycerophosphotransferase (TagB/SpsB family)
MADNAHSYTQALQGENVINVGGRHYPNIEVLYRRADLLITDYSSCFIDFMLTNKPMISFAYDYERYMREERGLFYELDFAFPGPICQDFPSLFEQIEILLTDIVDMNRDSYRFKQKLFFDYIDDANAKRVVERVKEER